MKIALAPIALGPYRSKPAYGQYINTYRNDLKTLLRNVKKCGYEGIEIGVPEGFTREEFKDAADEAGLQIVTAGGVNPFDLAFGDLKNQIADCKCLGARNLMIGHMPNVAIGNPAELRKFIVDMNRAGKILMEEGGIHLSYHNHAIDFSKIAGVTMLQTILDGTDPRYVFVEPDTHWLQSGGAHVVSWLKKLKGRMYMVHFKDYGIDPYSDYTFLESTHKLFMEIGEGNLNWPGIIAECLEQKLAWCAVEQDVVRKPAYEAIALSVKNLHAFGL
jgi:sugar phosphate isomerase/epimerase